jgi:hypothetical protein
MDPRLRSRLARYVALLCLAGVLALTFLAYLKPGFVLDMANRWLLCL